MPDAEHALVEGEGRSPTMVGAFASYLGVIAPTLGGASLVFAVIGLPASLCCGLIPFLNVAISVVAGSSSVAGVVFGTLAGDDQRLDEVQRAVARRDARRAGVGLLLSLLASIIQCAPMVVALIGWAVIRALG
jgi:hypothetical protein